MAKKFNDLIWIAIDIGTTKICVIVSRGLTPEQAEVLGVGQAPSDGLRRGVVVDIAKTVQSIRAAIAEAQLMSGISIESAVIGISGAHIHSRNSVGAVPILRGEVRPTDITNVINAAQAVSVAQGQQILHVLPQFYTVDDEYNIADPLGMSGVRLEVQVHIISGSVASVQNLIKCCQMAGVTVTDIVL
ncbi:MAG TPA: cell division protein FtsA, partial [Candidatus Babeliales bacterium]|nr:cell division protein FtsA [Candidatus Babeliales bacterium]